MMLGWKQNGGWKRKAIGMVMVVLTASLLVGVMAAQRDYDRKNEKAHRYPTRQLNVQFIRSNAIEVAIAANGQFTIGIPNGPILLYGHPNPWSSATTIRVDGVDYWNYDEAKLAPIIDGPRNESNLFNITVWNINGIQVTQTLTIVGEQLDVVKISYIIKNNTNEIHEVGLRLMLDTMLGDNDGAPFRVPGAGAVTREREWVGGEVPSYWQAFDRLEAYTVATQGTLAGGEATLPDRLVAAHWNHINDTPWDFVPDPNITFSTPGQTGTQEENDSAVGIYWNPVRLLPGQKRVIITYYGLSRFTAVGEQLKITEIKPSFDLFLSKSSYSTEAHVGAEGIDQTNVEVMIEVDENVLQVVDDKRKIIPKIKAGMTETISWKVVPTGNVEGNNLQGPAITEIKVKAKSDQVNQYIISNPVSVKIGPIFEIKENDWRFANRKYVFERFIPSVGLKKFFPPKEIWEKVYGKSEISTWWWEKNRKEGWLFRGVFPGVCYGMSALSLKYSLVGFNSYDREIDNILANAIFAEQIKWFSRNHIKSYVLNLNPNSEDPSINKGVWNLIKKLQSNGWDIIIYISGEGGAHALVPWKLENLDFGYKIYVYDPNDPGNNDRYIEIIKVGEQTYKWRYKMLDNLIWGDTDDIVNKGVISFIPIQEFYGNVIKHWDKPTDEDEKIIITKINGIPLYAVIVKIGDKKLIFDPVEGKIINNIPGAILLPSWVGLSSRQQNGNTLSETTLWLPLKQFEVQLSDQNGQPAGPAEFNALAPGGAIGVSSTGPVTLNVDMTNSSKLTQINGFGESNIVVDMFHEDENIEGIAHLFSTIHQGTVVNVHHINNGSGIILESEKDSISVNVELKYIKNGITSQGTVHQVTINPNQPVRVRLENPSDPTTAIVIEVDKDKDGTFEESQRLGLDTINTTLPAGVYPLSLPIVPRETAWEFLIGQDEKIKLAFWDITQNQYSFITLPYEGILPDAFKPVVGRAVWVKLESLKTVNLTGTSPDRLAITSIPLRQGWNLIGILSTNAVRWSLNEIRIRKGNDVRTLAQAQQAGWIEDYAWGWEQDANNPNTGRYVLVYDTSIIPGVKGQLEPWKGYWVYAHTDCELILPPPSQSKGRGTRGEGRVAKGNGWSMRLQASVNGSVGEAVIGIANGTRGLAVGLPPEPPTGNNGVQVILLKNNTPLAVDVRNDGARRQEWEVLVRFGTRDGGRGTRERKEVVLTFDGIGYAPKDVSAWLVDTVTGKRLYLRTQPSYRFVAQEGEVERKFKVVVERGNDRPLRVVGLKATPMRGQGVVIEFSLTKPAKVEAEVLTLTGRKVAVLDAGSSEGLTRRVVWRGVGIEGQKVGGVYLVRVRAVDEEGREVQAATVVRLR